MNRGLPTSVLMTSESTGDTWTFSRLLASGLSGLGVRVGLATFGPPVADSQKELIRAQGIQLFESGWEVDSLPCFRRQLEDSADWLLDLEERFRPELVHLDGLIHASLPWRRPTLVTVHECLPARWKAVHGTSLPQQWDVYHDRIGMGVRAAGIVVASSSQTLQELRLHHGAFAAGRVIPHGWPTVEVQRTKHRGFIFTAAGVWDDAYGLRSLEIAAPFAIWPVFCAGAAVTSTGERRPRPEVKNVCCLGELTEEELEGWLDRSSIFFMPALYSDGQMSILRAAARGCPLVLGNHPALKEIWGDSAVFVRSDDPEAIRVALERLIMDERKRQVMSMKARERARELPASVMLATYCGAYSDILTARAPARHVPSHAVAGA
jgi:hypothetical protein